MSLMASWPAPAPDTGRSGGQSWWRRLLSAWTDRVKRRRADAWRRKVRKQEAYLAQAVDLDDLDRRMRQLERDNLPARFSRYY